MELKLKWHSPLALTDASNSNGIYSADLKDIPQRAGIYIFYREHGASRKALYIGKATNLKSRIKSQLNNVRLMKGIENSSSGSRRIIFAEFFAKPGQQEKKCILVIERALIRHYLALGDIILNIQGTKIKSDSIFSERIYLTKFIPATIHQQK